MNVGSLFSGIGGIELGFEREGFETKWFVEKDEFCKAVLRKNFPGRSIYSDITKINFKKLEPVDIITGGFPCQDVSKAGKRKGMAGERSGLWKEYARAIREIRPKYGVIENVPGLLTLGLDDVLADLASIGYDAEWVNLFAADFGAPHRRERIFIICYQTSNDSEIQGQNSSNISSNNSRERYMEQWTPIDSTKRGKSTLDKSSSSPTSNTRIGKLQAERDLLQRKQNLQRRVIANNLFQRVTRFREETISRGQGFSLFKDVRKVEDLRERPDIPEPLFRGGRDGVPNWVDRVKSLGNAVVPECAQFIARQIKEKEELK